MSANPNPNENETEEEGAPGEVKDAFRDALERKRGKKHPHEAATQGDSKIHDSRGAAGGKRTFRRKSG
jgi:hypothetical protein